MFIKILTKTYKGQVTHYASLVVNRRKFGKVVQTVKANLGSVTEEQIPYLKAAYSAKKPRLVYDETPEVPPPKKADDVPQILKHRRTKMLTESEISALLEQKLQAKKQEMINAWMTFQRNPTAKTFKASEDIPDKLMGEVLDEVAKEVLASSAPTIKEDEPSKKNLGSQENER
jgi:type IV secretory pathway VirB10-like protein